MRWRRFPGGISIVLWNFQKIRFTHKHGLPHQAESFGAEEVRREKDQRGGEASWYRRVKTVKCFTWKHFVNKCLPLSETLTSPMSWAAGIPNLIKSVSQQLPSTTSKSFSKPQREVTKSKLKPAKIFYFVSFMSTLSAFVHLHVQILQNPIFSPFLCRLAWWPEVGILTTVCISLEVYRMSEEE